MQTYGRMHISHGQKCDVCEQVRKATGTNMAHTTQLIMTLLVGNAIGLGFSWQIGEVQAVSIIGGDQMFSRVQATLPS